MYSVRVCGTGALALRGESPQRRYLMDIGPFLPKMVFAVEPGGAKFLPSRHHSDAGVWFLEARPRVFERAGGRFPRRRTIPPASVAIDHDEAAGGEAGAAGIRIPRRGAFPRICPEPGILKFGAALSGVPIPGAFGKGRRGRSPLSGVGRRRSGVVFRFEKERDGKLVRSDKKPFNANNNS